MSKFSLVNDGGGLLLAGIFIILLLLQWRFPLRQHYFSVVRRLVRNWILSIPGFVVVRLAMLPAPMAAAIWAQDRQVGLLNWLSLPTLAVWTRDLSAHGLRLLVVALGQPYDPALLAVPQCAPYRPRPRCEYGRAISFRRNGFFHWIPHPGRRGFRDSAHHAARFFPVPRSGNTFSSF
jgi:hypothetical protein